MWTRKALKKSARLVVKNNYWRAIFICLFLAVFAGQYSNMLLSLQESSSTELLSNLHISTNAGYLSKVLGFAPGTTRPQEGVFASIFNNITDSGSVVFGLLNMVNGMIGGRLVESTLALLGFAIYFLYWVFVSNILLVGGMRFFLESRIYERAPVSRVLFLYRVDHAIKTAGKMLWRYAALIMWACTIVMFPKKYYEYRLMPFVLAENPNMSRKTAVQLSRDLCYGHKWNMFLLDASLFYLTILSIVTLGLTDLFFGVAYKNAVYAELYMTLRADAIKNQMPGYEYFNDRYLEAEPEIIPEGTQEKKVDPVFRMLEYPMELYTLPEQEKRQWMVADYRRTYSVWSLILLFFSFAMVGWIWEVSLHMMNYHEFVNRGTLHGPWLPIYGSGAVLVILLLKRFADRPVLTFGLTVLVCGTVEYVTSWCLEVFKHNTWWNYDGYLLNINGRVCAEGLLIFGLGGCAALYYAAPALDNLFKKIPKKIKITICIILVLLFVADLMYTQHYPNVGDGISSPIGKITLDHYLA